ncbi:hypothetical protein ACFQ1E_03680 [Sphingomonas canadensis]|uniref:Secreted protein n=1 Tax=Sphingomonas canadensis TaxID=1219257 RepID=A0ABW3H1V9_9SPHN|nr:hypothetical protein [Sphingomonas canadensis]MCW3834657.1 hypothetical protein [Sphingomonas canadensis]
MLSDKALRMALVAAAIAVPALWSGSAAAQNAPVNGVRLVYGNDPCPEGEICVRAPEADRYRIPKELRTDTEIPRDNQSWAVRQEGTLEAGGSGTGSCSATGAGGGTGCYRQDVKNWKADRKARKKEEANLPLP